MKFLQLGLLKHKIFFSRIILRHDRSTNSNFFGATQAITSAKLWIMFAKFEVRRLELVSARKISGTSIGMCPKEALFKGYIDLEVEVSIYSKVYVLIVVLIFYLAM